MPDTQERPSSGLTGAAISNAVVKITNQYTGRGPTKARTTMSEDLVVVVMADTMLKAERSLVDKGESEAVLTLRKKFQSAMREDMIATVEEHTGRTVAAFMSDNHIDPDMGVELFVLEPLAA